MRVRNVSPYGDLDVPLLGAIVASGATVDVSDAHAAILLDQADNWQPAAKASKPAENKGDKT